jgi:hypothetical protein
VREDYSLFVSLPKLWEVDRKMHLNFSVFFFSFGLLEMLDVDRGWVTHAREVLWSY